MLHVQAPVKADGDFPGLSFAYRFSDGHAEPLAGRDLSAAIAEPGGWIWVHLALTESAARDWIAHAAPLPERAREILLSEDEHQLLEPIEGGVVGVFADLLREFAGETRELGRLRFALTDTLVVSGRRAALGAIQRTLDSMGKGKRFRQRAPAFRHGAAHRRAAPPPARRAASAVSPLVGAGRG
jgi:zinc transporter